MHPRGVADEFLEEGAADDRAGLAPAGVLDVREVAFDLLAVFVEQGQLPDPFGAAFTRFAQPRHHVVVGAHHAGGLAAQSDHHGAGEGGQIDDAGGLVFFHGIRQGIGENQTALGVGVDYLDRFARHGAQNVAGFHGGAARQVLRGRYQAHHAAGIIQARQRLHGSEHRSTARHVHLHVFHAACRLDRNAAAVEGQPLANQHDRGAAGAPGGVFQNDEGRRLCAALRDAQQAAHVQFFHFRLLQQLAIQRRGFRQGLGSRRQVGRIDVIARTVAQVAGQRNGLGNRLTPLGAALQLLLGRCAGGQEGQLRQGVLVGLVVRCFVLCQFVQTQEGAFRNGLGKLGGSGRHGGWQHREAGGAELSGRGCGAGACLAQMLQLARLRLFAQANQQDARRCYLAARAEQRGAVQRALEIAALDVVADQPLKACVELGHRAPRAYRRALPQWHCQHVRRYCLGFVSLNLDKHAVPSLCRVVNAVNEGAHYTN